MEKKHKILTLLFAVITVVSIAGFYTSYWRYFPDFNKFQTTIHIHFAAFACWFALIIVQPILIRKKKYALHRKLGRFSYFLAPVIVITILLLQREKLLREIKVSEEEAALGAFISLIDVVTFAAYYLIAMINKNNLRWHVAFIVAATLVAFNPGMARLLNQFQPGSGLLTVFIPFILPIVIFLYEKVKFKRPILKSPYFLFFLLWTLELVLFITIPPTTLWQAITLNLANVLGGT